MKKYFLLAALLVLVVQFSHAQRGVDTIHYKKVYYFAGTGIAVPMGGIKDVMSPKLFAGSMGLDISLKNPRYYVYPALYMFSFNYNQLNDDPEYNQKIENGQAGVYMLNLSAGMRRQFNRLNTYGYLGPGLGLVSEPRANAVNNISKIENLRSFVVGAKVGVGADYKFKGFFLGGEIGYMYHPKKIQGHSFQALSILFGLKSDITSLSGKVVDVISSAVVEK